MTDHVTDESAGDRADDPASRMEAAKIAEALERATRRREAVNAETWSDEMFREQRDRDLQVRTVSSGALLRATLLTLLLAMLLTSGKLVEIAERQPLGGRTREFWLPVAEKVDRVANFLSLNRPADLIADIRGTGDDRAQTIDDIRDVIDESPEGTIPPGSPNGSAPPTTGAGGPTTTIAPATTTSVLAPLRTVTAAEPLRALFAGDSQAQYPAASLQLRLEERDLPVTLEEDARISTGLARPDVFNWPVALLDRAAAGAGPEAFILLFGANDNQGMVDRDGAVVSPLTPEWRQEYSARIGITMDALRGEGKRVLWVGQPPMRDGDLDEAVRTMNELAAAEAERRPWVTYVDIYARFAGPGGGYAADLDDGSGSVVRVRHDDGVHLNPTGAAWLSAMIADELERIWDLA